MMFAYISFSYSPNGGREEVFLDIQPIQELCCEELGCKGVE
jgi:hypothetical protein